jgi:predicted RNase H-like HicB family nuclease
MLTQYINAALQNATYEILEDGAYLGEIPGCPDLWAHAQSLEACRHELQEVLDEWIILGLRTGQVFPDIDGNNLHPDRPNTLAARAEAYEARIALKEARIDSKSSPLAS